jgi:hypothetical protein
MSSSSGPSDPIGGPLEAAIATHELFLSYVSAGFTKSQAMQLTCAVVAALVKANTGGDT